jgi:hypothetical protein
MAASPEMSSMIKRIAPFLALPVALAVAGPAAAGLSLQALFGGGTLTVENALFDNWTLNSLNVTDPGQTVDLSLIIVNEVSGDPLRPGLSFDGGGQLEETVRTSAGGTELAFKEAFVDTFLGDEQLSTSALFAPHSVLHITKDVYVFNDIFIGGEFELEGFGQEFSSVPGPATPLLVFAGLGALAALRRRQRGAGHAALR